MGADQSKDNIEPKDNPNDSISSFRSIFSAKTMLEEAVEENKDSEDNILCLNKVLMGGGITLLDKDPNNYTDDNLLQVATNFHKILKSSNN